MARFDFVSYEEQLGLVILLKKRHPTFLIPSPWDKLDKQDLIVD